VIDVARKVVGVGSVGLQAFILLLIADDQPLFLQLKQAGRSVLEPFAGRVQTRHSGRRVVVGQRTMQAASDLFLGWLTTPRGEAYYVRQLRDMKGSLPLEQLEPAGLDAYASLCGATLALAHARSGDAATIAGYVGRGDSFDIAIGGFARAYADQVERDHERFVAAIAAGRLEAVPDTR
jgi:uncharacterized protein (DUF2252 family)